jgi:hypothetical protein
MPTLMSCCGSRSLRCKPALIGINKPPMRRIYSPIDSKNVALMKKTGRCDPIFHEITPFVVTLVLGSVPDTPTVCVNFVPIWLHSAR